MLGEIINNKNIGNQSFFGQANLVSIVSKASKAKRGHSSRSARKPRDGNECLPGKDLQERDTGLKYFCVFYAIRLNATHHRSFRSDNRSEDSSKLKV